ncbi:tigger transposable element-derived protein 1 [Procambarus clarkii]|uniref:tigger transposable element-derived protein 1 n=1 Tax=Procambarus clarkii TaxID=6728 RepID=UPI0037446569
MGPKKINSKVQPKRKHVKMTIEQKQEIIRKHENGMRVVELATQYNKSQSTISTLIAKKKDIMSANVAKGVSIITKQRPQTLEDVEKLLLTWINDKQLSGDSLSETIICEKARLLHDDLIKKSPGTSEADTIDFKASRGWFEKFKKRSGIHNVVRNGKAASLDKEVAETFAAEFKEFVESEGYLPQQVFKCNEMGLFWKKMPKRTYITKEEKALPGHKPMKDRLTLVLCGNASGDLKIKPLLVYHSENPSVFKKYNVDKNKLNVMWRANSKACVTRQCFTEWVNEVFCPAIRTYLQEKSLPLKAVLLLDNAPAHPPGLEESLLEEFSFVTIKLLPSNTTPIQPMDKKIISNFKKLYTRALLRRCLEETSDSSLTLSEFWKSHFHILSCISLIDKAWEEVTQRTMISGWRNLWPVCDPERDFEGFELEPAVPLVEEIVSLGLRLGLELDGADVEELVEEHSEELTTEELLALHKEQQQETAEASSSGEEEEAVQNVPSSTIKKLCRVWEEIQSFVEKTHPEHAKIGRYLNLFNDTVMLYYRQLLLKRRQKQVSLDRYLVRKTARQPQHGPSGMPTKRKRESTPEMSTVPDVSYNGRELHIQPLTPTRLPLSSPSSICRQESSIQVSRSGRVSKKSTKMAIADSPEGSETRCQQNTEETQQSCKDIKVEETMEDDTCRGWACCTDDNEIKVKHEPLEVEGQADSSDCSHNMRVMGEEDRQDMGEEDRKDLVFIDINSMNVKSETSDHNQMILDAPQHFKLSPGTRRSPSAPEASSAHQPPETKFVGMSPRT